MNRLIKKTTTVEETFATDELKGADLDDAEEDLDDADDEDEKDDDEDEPAAAPRRRRR